MNKIFLATLCFAAGLLLYAAPDLQRRGDVLPGSKSPAGSPAEKIVLETEYAAAGTCAFWLRPDGWDNTDPAWHFFLTAGKQSNETAYIHLFRLPAGKIRLVWSKSIQNKEVTDMFTEIPFRSGEWHHLAFSWQNDAKGCVLKLYVDGKMISARRIPFTMGEAFPTAWTLGDVPVYRPFSKFKSTLGRIEFYKRALSADEVAGLAAQKFIDGRMSAVSRKFIPGSVNRVYGETAPGAKTLEAVFVTESGKETAKQLPFV